MTIFISYSHVDKAVVNNLAAHMVKRNAQVWVDTWELNVGDSIIQRIQEAITSSDALLVMLVVEHLELVLVQQLLELLQQWELRPRGGATLGR